MCKGQTQAGRMQQDLMTPLLLQHLSLALHQTADVSNDV